jgi:endonuclease YncB( thermonuclease family)
MRAEETVRTLVDSTAAVHDGHTMNPRAVVDRVIDGDTLWVRLRVRLNTNAPELGTVEGDAARDQLKRILHKGRRVQLVQQSVDDYGRIVAHLVDDNVRGPVS